MKNIKKSKCKVLLQQYGDEIFSTTIKIEKVQYKFFSKHKNIAEKVYNILISNCFFSEKLIDDLFNNFDLKVENKSNNNYFIS